MSGIQTQILTVASSALLTKELSQYPVRIEG